MNYSTILLALALTACGGSMRRAQHANTPDAEATEVCQADSMNNSNCYTELDTQAKYDQCLADHAGDVNTCDMLFRRGLYALNVFGAGAGYAVPLAPPGPNTWGGPGGPVHAGYSWNARNAQNQGPSNGSEISRVEYDADKKKTKERFKGLYNQVEIEHARIDKLEGATDPNGK
jgi:hypothetical protein